MELLAEFRFPRMLYKEKSMLSLDCKKHSHQHGLDPGHFTCESTCALYKYSSHTKMHIPCEKGVENWENCSHP